MMIALTGTPGSGKTSIAQELFKRGIPVTYASIPSDHIVWALTRTRY